MRHQKGTFSAFIIRLAIAATALSVAVLIASMAFIGGFKHAIREKLFSFWGAVLITPFDASSSDVAAGLPVRYDTLMATNVAGMDEVNQVYPFCLSPGIIQSKGTMEGVRLKGVSRQMQFSKSFRFSGNAINWDDTGYSKQIILSESTVSRLNIKIGETVRLYFISEGSPRIRVLKVTGTYHTGMEEIDRQFAICDMRLVQNLNNWATDDVSGYQVEIKNNALADTMAARIYEQYVNPPMSVQSVREVYPGVFGWLGTLDNNSRVLLIIVSIVAIINLSATMLILMVDRAVMIAMLKVLGMAPNALWSLFLAVAGLIGGTGIILGNLIGLTLVFAEQKFQFIKLPEETYNMSSVPVRISWLQVGALDISALALCVICALLPLLYMRKIQPARVLQFK